MSHEITDQNWQSEVNAFDGVVMIDFWAPWCGPCRVQGPLVEELATELKDNTRIKIAKLNVDENPQSSERQQILSIPTIKFFKSGEIVAEMLGLQSKEALASKIKELLS